jgi:UDP-2-acetamido-2,6-beta-L-arabino-hexul-4-ose reductase
MTMKVLVTGAAGFLGRNLLVRLRERGDCEVDNFTRQDPPESLATKVAGADVVYHLAGVNRPSDPREFDTGNADLTRALCDAVRAPPAVVFASSTQAAGDGAYGRSKRRAEDAVLGLAAETGTRVHVYRLPNVFGKWCRPRYNSVVATFCHLIARGEPIRIDDPSARLTLAYVDDVVDDFLGLLDGACAPGFRDVPVQYQATVGEIAQIVQSFADSRHSLVIPPVGTGLTRALYATYLSHLPTDRFGYLLTRHEDARGMFVEVLKTPDAGQFSFFTAHPGVTRGGHYHHTKTEKFIVLRGQALFRFRHLLTDEVVEHRSSGEVPEVVETIPGWVHDITNVGSDEMVVMLWANEIFDRQKPDTVASRVAA